LAKEYPFTGIEEYMDFAVITLYNVATDKFSVVFSKGVKFDEELVEESFNMEGAHTVGAMMALEDKKVDGQDPHFSLTGKSRSEYLEEAVRKLWL
jgi:hypothetical protein